MALMAKFYFYGKLFNRERNPEDGIVGEILANYLTEKEMQNNC